MGQEKFSWLDQYAPPVPAPAPSPFAPKPGEQEEKKDKFSFLDQFSGAAAPAAVPGVLPPYPAKEPGYGLPYIIKETVKGALKDIRELEPPSTYKPTELVEGWATVGRPPSEIQKVMNILYSGGRGFVHTALRDPLQFFLNSIIKGTSTVPGPAGALAGVAAAAKPQLPAFPEAARVTPLQDVAAGVGSFLGFVVGVPGKIGALTHGPIFQTVAKALAGKVPEKVVGIVAHLLAGSANLGVASVVAHPEVEGAFQRFTSGAVLGGIFGGTNLANFKKVAPLLNQMIRQVGSRAAAAVAGQYKPEFFNKIISGDITPEIAQDVFDELLFTWFSRPGVSAEGLKNDVLRIKDEARRANLKVYLGPEAEEALRWLVPIRETMGGLGKMAQGAGVSPAELLKPENLGLLQQFLGVPDKAALEMRLAQMEPTSARAPEQVETFADMPRELVPAGEVKPTPPKPPTAKPAPAKPTAPPLEVPPPEKPILEHAAAPAEFMRLEQKIIDLTKAKNAGERTTLPTKGDVPIVAEIEKAIAAGMPGLKKNEARLNRRSYTVDRPYGQLFIDADGEMRFYMKKGETLDTARAGIEKALAGKTEAPPGVRGEGKYQVRTDKTLRDAIDRVEKGEGSSEDIAALASAAKRSERLKALTEGYRGRLQTDLLTGVGSDRALVKIKDHAERRQYWLDLKGVKEGNDDPERGYRWTDENIFKPTGDVLKSSGADAYRRGGGSDEFIILSEPGEFPESFRRRISDIERDLRTKKVEFRGVLGETMGEAERLMAQKKKGEPVVPAPSAPGREAEPTGEVEFEAVAQKARLAMKDRRNGRISEGQAGEITHGDMIARLQAQGIPVDDMVPGWVTPEGKWTQSIAEATPKPRPIPATKPAKAAGETTPAGTPAEAPGATALGRPSLPPAGGEAGIGKIAPEIAREPWQMTREEWIEANPPALGAKRGRYQTGVEHSTAVKKALEEGKTVPEEVLADYPEFKFAKEEPGLPAEIEKAETDLGKEADTIVEDLNAGRKKWEDLTGNERDDVIEVYGTDVQDRYRREIREPENISDIEEALVRGRKLTKAQEKRAREAGILEEVPEKGEPVEPEIPKTPKEVLTRKPETPTGTMQLVNLAVRTPADTVFAFNNVPAKDLPKIREYAKKLGVEDKLIVGDEHAGTWGEAYSPAEHLAHVREILRDVKKQPKSVWQSWERHVKIDTSGLKPDDGPPVGLSVQQFTGAVVPAAAAKKPYMMSSAGRLYQNTIDKLHSLRKLGDFLRKDRIELFPENDPYIGARLYAGVQGKAEVWLFKKRFKMRGGNVVYNGESLSDILKPVRGPIEDFSRYLVYRRVPELEARGIETGIDLARAKAFVHQNIPRFETQAKKFTEYHDALLDVLVESGQISKEKADIIKTMNPNYASFQRVMDDIVSYGYLPTSSKFLAKIPNPIKQIRGSERPVIDPILSAIKATYVIQTVSERARINRQVIALRDLHPEIAKLIKPTRPAMELVATLEDGTKVFRPKKNQPEGIIESWKDGERHYYEVPLDLYQTMSLMDNTTMSWLVKALAIPARILRTGATTTPEFAFRNPFKDQWSGFVNARYGLFPGVDFVRGLFHMIGKDDLYQSWKAGGGDWSMVTALDRATSRKRLQEVLGRRDYLVWLKSPVKFLERLSMYTEMPTRIGAFARAKRVFDVAKGRGVTDVEAAYEAREATVDFARRGAKMKEISAIYTFFNARLQGIDRMARAFRERPMTTMARVFAVATLPSIINYFINRDDPKFQEIERWQRNLFWIVKVKDHYVRIPKGDVGVLFGTPVEMILEQLDGDPAQRPAIDKFAVDLFKETLPISDWGGLFPVALRPLFENYVNFNFFKKRTIVPMGMERLEPEFQSFPYTSESAKALGQVLHYSPAKIENFIRGYTGGLGTHALRVLDTILTKTGQIPEKPEKPKEEADIPGIGAFFVRHPEGFGSESAQKFYDIMKKIDQVKQTHSMLYQEKRKTELDAYVAKHPVEMKAIEAGFYSAFVKVRNEMSEIRKAQDRIYEDPKVEVNRKRLGLELLDRKIMILLVPLLNRYAALGEKYAR